MCGVCDRGTLTAWQGDILKVLVVQMIKITEAAGRKREGDGDGEKERALLHASGNRHGQR